MRHLAVSCVLVCVACTWGERYSAEAFPVAPPKCPAHPLRNIAVATAVRLHQGETEREPQLGKVSAYAEAAENALRQSGCFSGVTRGFGPADLLAEVEVVERSYVQGAAYGQDQYNPTAGPALGTTCRLEVRVVLRDSSGREQGRALRHDSIDSSRFLPRSAIWPASSELASDVLLDAVNEALVDTDRPR